MSLEEATRFRATLSAHVENLEKGMHDQQALRSLLDSWLHDTNQAIDQMHQVEEESRLHREATAKIMSLQSELSSVEVKLRRADGSSERWAKEAERLRGKMDHLRASVLDSNADLRVQASQAADLRRERDTLQQALSRAEAAAATADERAARADSFKAELASVSGKLRRAQDALAEREAESIALRERAARADSILAEGRGAAGRMAALQQQLGERNEEISQLRARVQQADAIMAEKHALEAKYRVMSERSAELGGEQWRAERAQLEKEVSDTI
jgi:chromosome segregation ATPase